MKIIKIKPAFRIILACVFFLLITALPGYAAEIDDSLAKCAVITDSNDARLKCFDDLAKKQIPAKEAAITSPDEKTVGQKSVAINQAKLATSPAPVSVMEKYWDMSLDPNKEKNIFALCPYRPNYLLPVAYNSSPNEDAQLDIDPQAKTQYTEAKFQISFKMKVWEDLVRGSLKNIIENNTGIKGVDVWIAYTQQSFWQLYNAAFFFAFPRYQLRARITF